MLLLLPPWCCKAALDCLQQCLGVLTRIHASSGPLLVCVQYGKVLSIDMKAPVRPPAFAFVEFG